MKIRLMIEGLCAFLPQPEGLPDTMHILIPDVRKSVERTAPDVTIHVCKHEPRLILPQGPPWELDGEHIVISDGTGGLNLDASFFSRISNMQQIAVGSEVLHENYLKDPPTPPSGPPPDRVGLVADLIIRNGTFSVADGDLNSPVSFLDRPGAVPTLTGQFAIFAQIVIDVPGDQAIVRTIKFGNGPETNRQQLEPRVGEEFVDILLRNRCGRAEEVGQPDNDFIIYYDLCHDYNGPRRIPYPLSDSGPVTPPGIEVHGAAVRLGGCIAALFRRLGRRPGP